MNEIKLLIAAGGTGGHLYPALAVFEQIKKLISNSTAVFVGNQNRIEGRVIPSLNYEFHHIPIAGMTKLVSLKTLTLPLKILYSTTKCNNLISKFKPNAVICTGSYIGYPAGLSASSQRVPLILMESNVIPGKTNKILASKASLIITNFEDTINYFGEANKKKVQFLGNPVRENILLKPSKSISLKKFGLNDDKKTLLVFGGSLGASSINKAVESNINKFIDNNIQIIWQTGSDEQINKEYPAGIKVLKYIEDMASAYSASDLVICRSGATTISEITAIGKASILIPYPLAANDHQRLNAKALESKNAAIMLDDNKLNSSLFDIIINLVNDESKIIEISNNAKMLGKPNATEDIANYIINFIK